MQVEGVASFDLERIGIVDVAGYAEREPMFTFENTTEIGPLGVATRTARTASGHRLKGDDELHLAMMTDASFAFSRLAPYDAWPSFSAEGLRLWEVYAATAQPESVTRVSLRYVNQIRPPAGQIDLAMYLRTRPEIAPEMPQITTGYFMSLDVPLPTYDATCRITETVIETPEGPALVLDIDVGRNGHYDPQALEQFRSILDVLRDAKNMVFEASITEAARELFS